MTPVINNVDMSKARDEQNVLQHSAIWTARYAFARTVHKPNARMPALKRDVMQLTPHARGC